MIAVIAFVVGVILGAAAMAIYKNKLVKGLLNAAAAAQKAATDVSKKVS